MRSLTLDYFHLPRDRKYHIHRIDGSEVSSQTHSHVYYQICYVECGRVEHSGVTLEAGDAFIVPPGFAHRILFPEEGTYLYSLSFQEELIGRETNVYRFLTALKLETLETERIPIRMKLKMDLPRQQTLKALLEALVREQSSTCPPELTAADSLIAAILCVFSQGYFLGDARQLEEVARYSHVMEQCLRYLDAHFTEELTLEDIARKFALSRSLFGLLFPRHTGTTFKRYLARKRISHAVTLLQSTQLPVHQIAAMCGYTDRSTFYRNFTKLTGRQPSDYRAGADLETQRILNMGWTF